MKKWLYYILIVFLITFWATNAFAVTLIGINSGMKITGRQLSQLDFSLSFVPNIVVVSGPITSTSTSKDTLFQTVTGGVTDTNATVNVTFLTGGAQSASFVSENPSIGAVDNNGNVTRIANGTAFINARSDWLTRQIAVPVSRQGGQSATTLIGYATSSLAKSDSDAIDTLIASAGATTTTLRLFSTQDHTNAVYVRNSSNWLTAGGVDTTCVAVWNSAGGTQQAGVLISPRHIAMANHFSYGAGTTVRFVDNSNNTITATVLTGGNVPGTDIWIDVLTADVPSSIKPCLILPSNYLTYIPSITATTTIPAVGLLGGGFQLNNGGGQFTHPDKMTTVRDLRQINNISGLVGVQFQFPNTLSTTTRDTFYYDNVIGGDSGNPAFLLVNNKLSLVTTWFSGGGGAGPSYPDNITGINSLITSLGSSGGWIASTTDLTGFNTY